MKKRKLLYYSIGIPVVSLILYLIYYVFLYNPIEINYTGNLELSIDPYYYSNKSGLYMVAFFSIIFSWFITTIMISVRSLFTPFNWKRVTVVKKHKKYSFMISTSGSGNSGYMYWIEFLDEEGNTLNYLVREDLYVFMVEGAKVKILCNPNGIRSFECLEEETRSHV